MLSCGNALKQTSKAKYMNPQLDLGNLSEHIKPSESRGPAVPGARGQRKVDGKMERQFDPRVGSMMWDLKRTKRGKDGEKLQDDVGGKESTLMSVETFSI